ncbi:MAG: hypothetical protein IJ158_01170 [Treponema sp.]|nr:hypothetical protein [Treponema sp.]
MKKTTFLLSILSILFAGIFFTSMSSNKTVSERGHINYYGNAPVETPAFVTDSGKIYLMEIEAGSKCTIEEILALQGNYLELTGTIEPEESKIAFPISQDGTFIISSYKKIEK